MNKGRIAISLTLAVVSIVVAIVVISIFYGRVIDAEKNLAYEYGRCVFYEQIPVEKCNEFSEQKGLGLYEKYYGDGSWVFID